MSPARLTVRAVVVSDGRAPQLAAVLESVLAQDPAPDTIHAILTADVDAPSAGWDPRIDVRRVDARGFGEALTLFLADTPARDEELLWLLHDDTAPLPGALAAMTATARKRQRAGVVGGAQVRWDDPSRLVALGTTTTRVGARRIALVEDDDVNQGQYDERDDVLAVSLGGALVRRHVWEELGGLDPALRGWSESLDFCRRVWRAGYDVVVVPTAKVRHSQESLYGRRGGGGGGRRSTYATRRASEWYHSLAYARWWAVPLVLVAMLLSAVGRALLRIAQNQPRMVLADLVVPWRTFTMLHRLPSSRTRVRRAGRSGLSAERRLLVGPRAVARHVRAREWGEFERAREAAAPTDVVKAELAAVRRRNRAVLAFLTAALAATAVAWHPDWFLGLMRGEMLTGGALGVTDASLGEVWDRVATGWASQGLGAPALDAGLATVLVPLAAVPGGLAIGLGLALALAPMWAGIGAWVAAGTVTRSPLARVLAAVVYAFWPAAVVSVEQGRVGAVLAHILLPWVVVGLARAGGWQRGERVGDGEEFPASPVPSPSAGMGAAAALGILVAVAPVVLAPAIVVVGILGAVAGPMRWRVWGTLIPAAVVAAPGAIAAWRAPSFADAVAILGREPGPSASSPARSSIDLLTGADTLAEGVPGLLEWAPRALAAVVVLAVVIAALVGARALVSALGLVAAAVGVTLAVAVQSLTMSPDAGAGAASASGWYGAPMSVVGLAAVVVIGAASADVWFSGGGRARAWKRTGVAAATAVACVMTAGALAAHLWPARVELGDVAAAPREVLPLVATLEQDSDARQRVLTLTGVEGGVEYAVLDADGTEVVTGAATLTAGGVPAARPQGAPVPGAGDLADAVAGLMDGRAESSGELAEWGIGVVVAGPGSDLVVDVLTQARGLSLIGASDRGTSWRIGAAEGPTRVARAWIESEGGVTAADAGHASGTVTASDAGVLVIAEAADSAWTATVNGTPLASTTDALGRQAFTVPHAGTVEYRYDDRAYRLWWWAAVAAVGWSLIGSIPARAPRARTESAS